jgi:uncharacterized protein
MAGAGASKYPDVGTFVLKVASRCNLDCTYCYVYRSQDQSWRDQPPLMAVETATLSAERIVEHCRQTGRRRVLVNLHGGEPLIGGTRHLGPLAAALGEVFSAADLEVSTAVQTNGLLLTDDVAAILHAHGYGVFVSMDGPPEVADRYRIDRRGQPTGRAVERHVVDLLDGPHRDVFAGILCVVDPTTDPDEVLDYLLTFRPPLIDLLLPLDNHDRPPVLGLDRYATWMQRCFDRWFELDTATRIRTFDARIMALLGHRPADDALALVIETDGSYQLDDTLKTAAEGAGHLGVDVFGTSVSEVMSDPRVQRIAHDAKDLSATCRSCGVVDVCQGGHLSHRYSSVDGFDNPSVYCAVEEQLARHVAAAISEQLPAPTAGLVRRTAIARATPVVLRSGD